MKQYIISQELYHSSNTSYTAQPITSQLTHLVATDSPATVSRDVVSREDVLAPPLVPHTVLVYENERVFQLYRETYVEKSRNPFVLKQKKPRKPISNRSYIDKLKNDLFPVMEIENRIMDVVLGCLVFYYVWYYVDINCVSKSVIQKTNEFADYLYKTISWLAEAPVGLKLNKPLGEFLGLFFRYLIHLFKGYIDILSDHIPILLSAVSCVSILGFTNFLSFLVSFSVMLMIHVHCFYACACKVYSAQLKAVISLGRLLIGNKYNPLRNRVDSVSAQGDQLILGTLIFSTLLFLLPTVALYYVVFTSVNGFIVLLQSILLFVVHFMRSFPLRKAISICCRRETAILDVTIRPLPLPDGKDCTGSSVVKMFVIEPVFEELSSCFDGIFVFRKGFTAHKIFSCLVNGRIIKITA